MPSAAQPVPPHRFAEAIRELPLSNLHSKAAEIRNSIAHLDISNQQLQPYADYGDRDCAEAIQENVVVIQRQEERIRLLKEEVEGRVFKRGGDEGKEEDGNVKMNGVGHDERSENSVEGVVVTEERRGGGISLEDEELAGRLREQMEEDEDGEDGVHL